MLYVKSGMNGLHGFRGDVVWKYWQTTDGRQMPAYTISSRSGELTSSPKGNDCSPESSLPKSICPKTSCSLSPTLMMLHIKLDQDWPTGFRDIKVQKCEIFVTQGQVTPKWVGWFGPKSNSTELLCLSWLPATLMMIQSKMNELAWRHLFPLEVYENFFRRSRTANSVVSGPIWPIFELVRDFMHVLVT